SFRWIRWLRNTYPSTKRQRASETVREISTCCRLKIFFGLLRRSSLFSLRHEYYDSADQHSGGNPESLTKSFHLSPSRLDDFSECCRSHADYKKAQRERRQK